MGQEAIRYIDLDSGNEEREIVGLSEILKSEVENIRGNAELSGLNTGRADEISNIVLAVDENGHVVLNVQLVDRSIFLSTRDSVLENGKLEKRWVRRQVTKGVDRFGIWLSPSSLRSPYSVTDLSILNDVVYARGAEGPYRFARSVDSGRTWEPVSIYPVVDQMTAHSDTIVAFHESEFWNDSIYLSTDNGATWGNTGLTDSYRTTVYFRGGFGWISQNTEASMYLYKFPIGSKNLKVVVAGQFGKASTANTDYGIAVLDDQGNGKFWESSLERWKVVELTPVQLGANKARFHQGYLHVFQGNNFGTSKLLKYKNGAWELVCTGIQDFEVQGDHLFAIGKPELFESHLVVQQKFALAWHRPILRSKSGRAWDTLYWIQTTYERLWEDNRQAQSRQLFADRIGVGSEGELRVIFIDSGNYMNHEPDTVHSLFSTDEGITWRPSPLLFQAPPHYDHQRVQLDELGYFRIKTESNAVHLDPPQLDARLSRGRLDLSLEIGQQYRIESIALNGGVQLLFEGQAHRAGNHSFEIPKGRTVRYLRVVKDQRSRVLPNLF